VFACSGTITLTATVTIATDSQITASGYDVIIDGGSAIRLFQVNSNVNLEMRGLTLANGASIGAPGINSSTSPTAGGDGFGGGILNLGGTVTLIGCALTNQVAQGGHAGEGFPGASPTDGGSGFGGAICNLGGRLNLVNCVLAGNRASGGTSSELGALSISGGHGGQALGGAIYSANGVVTIDGATLKNNLANGGMWLVGNGGDGAGGALYASNSMLLVGNSLWQSNRAVGGACTASSSTSGHVSGAGLGGALFLTADSSARVWLSSLQMNSAQGGAGLSLAYAGFGLGGAVYNAGALQASDSAFSSNGSTAGDISLSPPVGRGGGIYSTNQLVVSGCTFAGNAAIGGDPSSYHSGMYKGGTGDGGAVWSSGALAVTNSTFATNRAAGGFNGIFGGVGARGGGLCVSDGTAILVNVTIAGNRADGWKNSLNSGPAYGGGLGSSNATVTVANSIFANSSNGGEVSGAITDGGFNICSDATANFSAVGSRNSTDPLLGPLENNGGPTATMVLQAASLGRDAILSGLPPVDQRGVARPQGPAGDMGAVEGDKVVLTPRLTIGLPGAKFAITFTPDLGSTYRLLTSTNLVNWRPVATNSSVNTGSLQFAPPVTTEARLFFRVVTP